VPVKTGEVNQHNGINVPVTKNLFGLIRELIELAELWQHLEQADNRVLGQITIDVTAGLAHRLATESAHSHLRGDSPDLSDQPCRVLIPARFAN
jgi:hypothetical protein